MSRHCSSSGSEAASSSESVAPSSDGRLETTESPSAGSHRRLPRLRNVTIVAHGSGAVGGAENSADPAAENGRRTTSEIIDPAGVAARLAALELAVHDVQVRSGQSAAALERIEELLRDVLSGATAARETVAHV